LNTGFMFRTTSRRACTGTPPHSRIQFAAGERRCVGRVDRRGARACDTEVAGLPERVLVFRDLELMNPDAPPSSSEPVVPKPVLDPDGDVANNNTGFGKPARDLSVNFVPCPTRLHAGETRLEAQ